MIAIIKGCQKQVLSGNLPIEDINQIQLEAQEHYAYYNSTQILADAFSELIADCYVALDKLEKGGNLDTF